jgi:hypothetical protein
MHILISLLAVGSSRVRKATRKMTRIKTYDESQKQQRATVSHRRREKMGAELKAGDHLCTS